MGSSVTGRLTGEFIADVAFNGILKFPKEIRARFVTKERKALHDSVTHWGQSKNPEDDGNCGHRWGFDGFASWCFVLKKCI